MRNKSIILDLTDRDVSKLVEAEKSYGHSWISRGLRGAYFVMVRKIDRFENQMRQANFDLPAALRMFPGKDGILDDIRDLRQYLLLIEAEIIAQAATLPSDAARDTFEHRGVEPSGDDRWFCGMCTGVFSLPHGVSPSKHECPALGASAGARYIDQARDTPEEWTPPEAPIPPASRRVRENIFERPGAIPKHGA